MTRVEVDADRCVGHGRCYALAPKVFDADDVGHAIVIAEEVSGDLETEGRDAERNCPERAITLS
ncbi:cytochrome [Mycobacterium sp. 1245111.1]|uniref:ferredoxin n=1 Tax=Mycobacterium sp. 1245111.1 TaxID=1834073 RepID=UPI0007FC31CA|nr:ferredoxin [Mycobacterium sp. 1245111.1]OBK41689.1 cytochrome [Mycobacterium sp. 1245111.1]